MGNKRKAQGSRNDSKHVFKKRIPPHKRKQKQMTNRDKTDMTQVEREVTSNSDSVIIGGCRIINMDKLKQYMNDLTLHVSGCGGSVILDGETRHGLASILTGKCSKCSHCITLETSSKVKGPSNYARWECNLAAVWGQMATGGGHSHLEETMGVLGVPVMTKSSFISRSGSGGRRS